MTIHSEVSNGILLMRLHQDVDHAAAAEIYDRLSIMSDNEIKALLLDLTHVQYASASLLRVILSLADRPAPMPVAVVGAGRQFQSLVKLCGANVFIKEYQSIETAQNALKNMHYADPDTPFDFEDEDEHEDEDEDDEDDDLLAPGNS